MKTLPIILSALLLTALPLAAEDSGQGAIDQSFREAVRAHDTAAMRRMLSGETGGKPSTEAVSICIRTLAETKDIETVRILLANGFDVNTRDAWDNGTLLTLAARTAGNADMLRLLLEAGADVRVPTAYRGTALLHAVCAGDKEMVRILVEAGAPVNPIPDSRTTMADLLTAAAGTGDVALLDYLLEHGAEFHPGLYGHEYQTPVLAAVAGGNPAMVERVLALGMDIDRPGPVETIFNFDYNDETATPLMLAAYLGDTAMVRLLLEKGADAVKRNSEGRTALMAAALPPRSYYDSDIGKRRTDTIGDRAGCIRLLLQAGLDADATTESGQTALFTAAQMDSTAALEALLAAGASVDKANYEGMTPLMNAARWGNANAVRLLLAAGADANARDLRGRTVLWHAAFGGNASAVEQLLAAGADPDATDYLKRTPLMIAAGNSKDHGAVTAILAGKCKDINATDAEGHSALHHAGKTYAATPVRILLEAGADANLKDRSGLTADEHMSDPDEEAAKLIKSYQH